MSRTSTARERILFEGPASLSDADLVALLLRTGTASPVRKPVGTLSRDLMHHFGSLNAVLTAPLPELRNVKGLGPAKVASLLAAREIASRLGEKSAPGGESAPIQDEKEAFALFRRLGREDQEVLSVAYLSAGNRVLYQRILFRGSLDTCKASVATVLSSALRANAARILIAHNHPSGDPEPSESDRMFTTHLSRACREVGLVLLDHLIVCRSGRFFSFRKAGLLTPFEKRKRREAKPKRRH